MHINLSCLVLAFFIVLRCLLWDSYLNIPTLLSGSSPVTIVCMQNPDIIFMWCYEILYYTHVSLCCSLLTSLANYSCGRDYRLAQPITSLHYKYITNATILNVFQTIALYGINLVTFIVACCFYIDLCSYCWCWYYLCSLADLVTDITSSWLNWCFFKLMTWTLFLCILDYHVCSNLKLWPLHVRFKNAEM